MLSVKSNAGFVFIAVAAVLSQALTVTSVAVPSSNCYAFDNTSHLFDFSDWVGVRFTYEEKDNDFVIRFCKDVESRSKMGYVDFGRFDKSNYFVAGSGHVDLVQEYYNGDLLHCEHTFDKMGRTAQDGKYYMWKLLKWAMQRNDKERFGKLNDMINSDGNLRKACNKPGLDRKPWSKMKDPLGCICNVTYESTCRAIAELAIPCEKPGPRVFEGFTVGFHPRSWEIVYNGLTQLGFEKSCHDFSFSTEQPHVTIYLTAIASQSNLVQKPLIKVFPENGLEVKLSGTGTTGKPPTTLSPSTLILDWRCVKAHDTPYEINITIPVEGYESIEFVLTKTCEYTQNQEGDAAGGWAIFGITSCIFMVSSTLFCCGGFIYKTRVEHQRGIDALPGMTILSACLETVSGAGQGYSRAENPKASFASEVFWERPPAAAATATAAAQGTWTPSERKYGTM